MTRLEMVEKIREKTGVTYDVAKEALENCDWDMLDAIVTLKHDYPDADNVREDTKETAEEPHTTRIRHNRLPSGFGTKAKSVLAWLCSFINKGENIRFEISHSGQDVGSLSITVLVLLMLLKWWIPVGLIIVGWFCGYRYRFTGASAAGRILNGLSDKAGDKAEEIKKKLDKE